MTYREHQRDLKPVAGAVYGLAGAGAVALIVGLAAFAAPRPAGALPAYAQQTSLPCGRCHVNAAGGGPRNSFGSAFAANGHKLPSAAGPGKAGDKGASAAKPGKASVGGGAPAVSVASGGGGYSGPAFGYSNALFFRIYP